MPHGCTLDLRTFRIGIAARLIGTFCLRNAAIELPIARLDGMACRWILAAVRPQGTQYAGDWRVRGPANGEAFSCL